MEDDTVLALRTALHRLPAPSTHTGAAAAVQIASAHALQRRRSRYAIILSAGIVAALLIGVTFAVQSRVRNSPSVVSSTDSTNVASWPLRGQFADNPEIIAQAEAVWRAADPKKRPKEATSALFAGIVPGGYGTLVVLMSTSGPNVQVAFVTTALAPNQQATGPSFVRTELEFPVTESIRSLGFITPTLPADKLGAGNNVAIALLASGATQASIRSSVIDDMYTDGSSGLSLQSGALFTITPSMVSSWNATLNVVPQTMRGHDVLGGISDVNAVQAIVTQAEPETLEVQSQSGALHVGALVTTSDGVVGIVSRVMGLKGQVDLRLDKVSESGYVIQSAISDYRGIITSLKNGSSGFVPAGPTPKGVHRLLVILGNGEVSLSVGTVETDQRSPMPLIRSTSVALKSGQSVWIFSR